MLESQPEWRAVTTASSESRPTLSIVFDADSAAARVSLPPNAAPPTAPTTALAVRLIDRERLIDCLLASRTSSAPHIAPRSSLHICFDADGAARVVSTKPLELAAPTIAIARAQPQTKQHGNRRLTDQQEMFLVTAAVAARDGFSISDLRSLAARSFSANDDLTAFSSHWANSFCARHRLSLHRAAQRYVAAGPIPALTIATAAFHFLCSVRSLAVSTRFDHILNLDETSVFMHTPPARKLAPKGSKHTTTARRMQRETCTALITTSATGRCCHSSL